MIRSQWYVILESKELKHKPIGVTRLGEKLVVWRDAHGSPQAMADQCPHRGASLSQGEITNGCIQCPFHGFEFDGSGKCVVIPANGRASEPPRAMHSQAYPLREDYGYIWMWYGDVQEEYPALPWFSDLDETFGYASMHDHWPVHYTRGAENQLDVIHLPFVHASTIGSGGKTVIDGPLTRLENGELEVWVNNRVDDGCKNKRAEELNPPRRPPFLRFIFPNNWMNRISDDFRITISFVPVDEENTLFYLRHWMKKGSIPFLASFFAWLALPSSRVILNQDKRVVTRQRPIKGELTMGEILIPQDGPIIQFRRWNKDHEA